MRTVRECSAIALCTLAFAGLAGCQSRPTEVSPPAAAEAEAASPAVPAADQDTCQAASYSALVGKDYKQVPPAPEGKVIRVLCTTCPMTMDFNAERINVFYERDTGRITRLSCG